MSRKLYGRIRLFWTFFAAMRGINLWKPPKDEIGIFGRWHNTVPRTAVREMETSGCVKRGLVVVGKGWPIQKPAWNRTADLDWFGIKIAFLERWSRIELEWHTEKVRPDPKKRTCRNFKKRNNFGEPVDNAAEMIFFSQTMHEPEFQWWQIGLSSMVVLDSDLKQ